MNLLAPAPYVATRRWGNGRWQVVRHEPGAATADGIADDLEDFVELRPGQPLGLADYREQLVDVAVLAGEDTGPGRRRWFNGDAVGDDGSDAEGCAAGLDRVT